MKTINITEAKNNLDKLVSEVNKENNPITIVNSNGKSAILISEDGWNTIAKTLYYKDLLDIKNTKVAILEMRNYKYILLKTKINRLIVYLFCNILSKSILNISLEAFALDIMIPLYVVSSDLCPSSKISAGVILSSITTPSFL